MFNKWQAQRWWSENSEKIMELYNVQHFNQQGVPLPSPPRSEDESSITESIESCPVTPPLTKEHTPRNFYHPAGMGYSSSDSLDQQPNRPSLPKLSNRTKTKTSSVDADQSARTSSSREADQSGENAMENEWIEQDEPVEKGSGKCMRECGGNRTGRGYNNNTYESEYL
nr:hypothetical protein [Tanacetum cinerariifolium]